MSGLSATDLAAALVGLIAGAVAAVTGFGIGSLLTPLLAWQVDTRVAVAAVAIPHLAGTGLRLWLLRGDIDRRVLVHFGLASAAGGLTGAVLHRWVHNRGVTIVFGVVLLLAAFAEITGLARRLRIRGWKAWLAGALSGVLGGLVGNQGGVRAAGLIGFELSKKSLVATATAVALVVDGVRIPVYLRLHAADILPLSGWMALATIGVLVGTLLGTRVLAALPEVSFRRVLAVVLVALGAVMLTRGAFAP